MKFNYKYNSMRRPNKYLDVPWTFYVRSKSTFIAGLRYVEFARARDIQHQTSLERPKQTSVKHYLQTSCRRKYVRSYYDRFRHLLWMFVR